MTSFDRLARETGGEPVVDAELVALWLAWNGLKRNDAVSSRMLYWQHWIFRDTIKASQASDADVCKSWAIEITRMIVERLAPLVRADWHAAIESGEDDDTEERLDARERARDMNATATPDAD